MMVALILAVFSIHGLLSAEERAPRLVVASYNVNNYRLMPSGRRAPRPESERIEVMRAILFGDPDIIALQEIGSLSALNALMGGLEAEGAPYPYWEFLPMSDQDIQCAVLSRYPIVESRSRDRVEFVLYGRTFSMLRGLMELDIQVAENFRLTLMNVHLKSRLPVWFADEADYRLSEAQVLRERISEILDRDSGVNLIVLGDFNDTPDSRVVKTVIGRGKKGLNDARPIELCSGLGNFLDQSRNERSGVAWTHHFGRQDGYYRYDYVLFSDQLKPQWIAEESRIPSFSNWAIASDHRLIQASFRFR